MNLRKILTLAFAIYIMTLIAVVLLNESSQFIEDGLFINMMIVNLVFIITFFIMGLVTTNQLQTQIVKQDKIIKELKGKLYDTIKDDEDREKMLKDFEKSISK